MNGASGQRRRPVGHDLVEVPQDTLIFTLNDYGFDGTRAMYLGPGVMNSIVGQAYFDLEGAPAKP